MQDSEYIRHIKDGYQYGQVCKELLKALKEGQKIEDSKLARSISLYSYKDEILQWVGANQARIMVPEHGDLRNDLIREFHEKGHLGIEKTYSSLARYLYWPRMHDEISQFVSSCHSYRINKVPNKLPAGELCPYDIPYTTWEVAKADFLTELPLTSEGHDAVLVIVDNLSK